MPPCCIVGEPLIKEGHYPQTFPPAITLLGHYPLDITPRILPPSIKSTIMHVYMYKCMYVGTYVEWSRAVRRRKLTDQPRYRTTETVIVFLTEPSVGLCGINLLATESCLNRTNVNGMQCSS